MPVHRDGPSMTVPQNVVPLTQSQSPEATTAEVVDVVSSGSNSGTGAASKRKYSRNGCNECKKRRMKCDETKPKCWQCARLGRECVYVMNRKNRKRRTKSEIALEEQEKHKQQLKSPLSTVNGHHMAHSHSTSSSINEMPINSDFAFSLNDANTLYHDLNDLVNWKLEEALTPNLKTYIEESTTPFNTDLKEHSLPLTTDKTQIIFDVPLESFNLGNPHNDYLRRSYHDFITLMCPFVPNVGQNPVRDVLLNYAKRETYLLYAILACGARMQHRISLDTRDDQAYCSYLSSCLNILSENFANEYVIAEKVEPMLLTILLLTSDCASSKSLRWRAHLKGAKELLKKTTVQSDTLNFCRNWLITYEVLAGMTNVYGGIFQSDGLELNKFISNDQLYLNSLKRLNMVDVHGFNHIAGHIIQLDVAFRDIMKVLNRIRRLKTNGEIPPEKSHLDYDVNPKVLSLKGWNSITNQLDNIEQISIIDKSGVIPPSNPNHPSQNRLENFDSISTIKLKGQDITLSWFDISNQGHIITARLVFLVRVLEMPKTNVFVQELVKKGLSYLEFLREVDDYMNVCMSHLHIMIAVIGKLCIREEDQTLVEIYLKILYRMGFDSADHNLKKFKRIWNNEVTDEDFDDDVLTW